MTDLAGIGAAHGDPVGDAPPRREVPLVPAASIAGRALVTVIAIMTFLASLAAGGAELVAGASRDWQHDVAREMTIQVRPVAGHDVDAGAARAAEIARAAPGVASAEVIDKEAAEKLLEPWLGTGLDLGDLPIPRLVVVRRGAGAGLGAGGLDLAALRARLAESVVGVTLDDHGAWQDRLSAMADTLVAMAVGIVLLVLTALGLAIAFATRGVVAGSREIIGILHFVGAEDRFIAGEFQRHFLRLGLRGGLIGGCCASLGFLAAGLLTARAANSAGADQIEALFGTFALGLRGYGTIAAIALGTALATGSMSRAIVFRHLRALE